MSEKKFRETPFGMKLSILPGITLNGDELNIDVDMELEVFEYKIDKRRKDCVYIPATSQEVANSKQ